jgi:hypothetical protein
MAMTNFHDHETETVERRRRPQRTCPQTGKQSFAKLSQAQRKAALVNATNQSGTAGKPYKNRTVAPYRCRFCREWHLARVWETSP